MSTAMRRAASPGTSVGCTLWGRVIGLGSTGNTKRESFLPREKVMNVFTPSVQAILLCGIGGTSAKSGPAAVRQPHGPEARAPPHGPRGPPEYRVSALRGL